LLYIEAIYHIKQHSDSLAKPALENIINLYPNSPMKTRAETLLDVLSRRKQIEEELTRLQVTRLPDDNAAPVDTAAVAVKLPPATTNKPPVVNVPPKPVVNNPPVTPPKPKDNPPVTPPAAPKYIYKNNPDAPHYATLSLEKVDNIFANEARNSFIIFNRSLGRVLSVAVQPVSTDNKLLLVGPFNNAAEATDYVQKAKEKAATEIIPWLDKAKYSFLIISPENLPLLKDGAVIANYKAFLQELYPGKF
jgi:hypothetical protein